MAGIKWQFRATETYDFTDGMWYGEGVFNSEDNCFGIQDDVYLGWWPKVDRDSGDLTIASKNFFTGKGGTSTSIQVSWEFADELQFRPFHPTYPYVEEYAIMPYLLSIKADAQSMRLGPDERLNSGYANSLENFEVSRGDMGYDQLITKAVTTSQIKQLSGNGFVWVKSPDPNLNVHVKEQGSVDNAMAIKNKNDSNQTWQAKGKNVIGFFVPAADALYPNVTRGIGYRSWVYSPGASEKKLTFSMVANAFGRPGLTFSMRVGYPGNWQLVTVKLDTEFQKHVTLQFDPVKVKDVNRGKPLCIDWFYDWYYDFTTFVPQTGIRFEIGCMTVHEGWIGVERLNPAFHAPTMENAFALQYGFQGRTINAKRPRGSVAFHKPLLTDNYRLSLTSDKKMVITEKTRNGFVYAAEVDDNTDWTFTYSTKVAGDVSDII